MPPGEPIVIVEEFWKLVYFPAIWTLMAVPTVPAPGAMLVRLAGGLIVMLDGVAVVNAVLPAVPETATLHSIGALVASPDGIAKEITRLAPTLTTPVDVLVTGAPLPAGGVIVIVTPLLGMVPAGNPVPETETVLPTVADPGVVAELSTTCPYAAEAKRRTTAH
jgi:hypothetical protein